MVRPILEYASSVWDPHEEQDKHALEMVQRRAARFAFNNYFETTPGVVTNMLTSLGWPTLEERRRNNRLIMLFKIQHNLVGIDPTRYLTDSDARTRGSKFRQDQTYHRAIWHTFFPRTTSEWNHLPMNTSSAPSLEVFRSRLSGSSHQLPRVGNP